MIMRAIAFTGLFCVVLLSLDSSPRVQAQDTSKTTRILQLNNLGVAWLDQLKFDKAVERFEELTRVAPRFVPGWVNLGIARYYDQDPDGSLEALKRALELDARQIQAHYLQGLIYRVGVETEEALAAFARVLELDPDDPAANYFLGNLYRSKGDFESADRLLRKAIELEPYNKSAYYALAQNLLRSDRKEEGRRMIERFQELDRLSGTTTIGLDYREQGRHAIAIDRIPDKYLPGSADVPPAEPITVTFSEDSESSGLRFLHSGSGTAPSDGAGWADWASFLGSGVSIDDFDGDGWLDVYLANTSAAGAAGALFRNRGDGTFEDVTARAGLTGKYRTMTALWGDYDNDEHSDLYLINFGPNRLFRNKGDGTFEDVTQRSGVGDDSWGLSGLFVDYDHDDDLDILIANLAESATGAGSVPESVPGAPNRLYRNNRDGTFTDVSKESGLDGGKLKTVAVLAADFNNSRDIDFYFVNFGAPNQLFSNNRDGTFRDVAAEVNAAAEKVAGSAVALGDLNRDASMDLILPSSSGAGTILTNQKGRLFQPSSLERAASGVHSSQLFDFDNDGDLDLLLVAAPHLERGSAQASLQLLENRNGRVVDATAQKGLDRYGNRPLRGAATGDLDNDGDLDIVVNVNGGRPLFLRNQGGNRNNWISIDARGFNSNKPGLGAKVEIRAGGAHFKSEVAGGHGLLSQSSRLVHFGLGKRTRVDFLRLLWPGGVLQSELNPSINQRVVVTELDRKGTSCPLLYAWDGEGYTFVSDFLGGSAYGYRLGPNSFNTPDTDEYIPLDRERVKTKKGRIAITMNNQLEEVIFFDHVELVVVDHPGDYEVTPDEKLLPGPPYDSFRLLTVSDARPPVSARDGKGRDILGSIEKIDRDYPNLFENLPFKGYAEPHEMILDLGPVSTERVILLMHAWIDYADSTGNLAASQAGLTLSPPRLQVRDDQGRWVTAIERMGFPAGLPKTMTVDLSGRFLSDSREVRILTNMRIYWDRILVESGPARTDYRLNRLPASLAALGFHGFPEFSSPDGRDPKVYFYDRVSPLAPWKVHTGDYTRYGDVRPLLESRDDMYVITRSGDEVAVFFETSGLPPLEPGWVRDYLVYVDGFGKDMDINSASPDSVEPLPFHSMSAFPYPESEGYPQGESHRLYRERYNTRREKSWIRE